MVDIIEDCSLKKQYFEQIPESLQGQFACFHVWIALLKPSTLSVFLKLSGKISEILSSKNASCAMAKWKKYYASRCYARNLEEMLV